MRGQKMKFRGYDYLSGPQNYLDQDIDVSESKKTGRTMRTLGSLRLLCVLACEVCIMLACYPLVCMGNRAFRVFAWAYRGSLTTREAIDRKTTELRER